MPVSHRKLALFGVVRDQNQLLFILEMRALFQGDALSKVYAKYITDYHYAIALFKLQDDDDEAKFLIIGFCNGREQFRRFNPTRCFRIWNLDSRFSFSGIVH